MTEIKKMVDVAKIVAGSGFNESFQGKTNLPIPFIKVSDFKLSVDNWLSSAANTVNEEMLKDLRAKKFPAGTIIFPKVGGALLTNKRTRLAVDAAMDNNIMGLIPRGIDPDYLFYFMCMFDMATIANAQALPSVNASTVEQIEIPVPKSIDKQCKIATKLKAQLAEVETARKALEIQENDINKLEIQLLESIFTQSKPEKFLKIGDVANTTSGSTPSRDNKEYWKVGQYAWVKTGEIVNKPIFKTEESISEKALKECSLTLLPPKTVLIAMYGQGKTRGQSAVLEIPATTNQACFAILPNETFHAEYLQYWLRHSYSNLRLLSEGRGGNQSNFNGAMLKEFTVPFLPKDQQLDVVNSINAMLHEIEKVKASIQTNKIELSLLPNRLLAQAFNTHTIE